MTTEPPDLITAVVETWRSGPLPPARELGAYDAVVPGLAERIVRGWEAQVTHRLELERAVAQTGLLLQCRGQWIASALASVAIIGGIVLTALGASAVGLTAILAPLAATAGAFAWGQIRPR